MSISIFQLPNFFSGLCGEKRNSVEVLFEELSLRISVTRLWWQPRRRRWKARWTNGKRMLKILTRYNFWKNEVFLRPRCSYLIVWCPKQVLEVSVYYWSKIQKIDKFFMATSYLAIFSMHNWDYDPRSHCHHSWIHFPPFLLRETAIQCKYSTRSL